MVILDRRCGVEISVVTGPKTDCFKFVAGKAHGVGSERVVIDAVIVGLVGRAALAVLGNEFKHDERATDFLLFKVAVIHAVVGAVDLNPFGRVENELSAVAVIVIVVHILFVGIHVDDGGIRESAMVGVAIAVVGSKLYDRRTNFAGVVVAVVEEKPIGGDVVAPELDERFSF